MICPNCGSQDVQVQTFQENRGSRTKTRQRSKTVEKRHGCLWWILGGWMLLIIDMLMWVFLFPINFIRHLFYKRKRYVTEGTTVSNTRNRIAYRTVCVCQNCGKRWSR